MGADLVLAGEVNMNVTACSLDLAFRDWGWGSDVIWI